MRDFYVTPHRISSLGALIALRIIQKSGIQVSLIDGLRQGKQSVRLPLPDSLEHLKPHIIGNETGKTSYFSNFYHFGRSFEDIVGEITALNPTICFIGCFAFCYGDPVIDLSRQIRESLPYCTIAACGAGVSVYPDFFLRSMSIDYTLSGEAETFLPGFLEFILNGYSRHELVPGLGWKTREGYRRYASNSGTKSGSSIEPVIATTFQNDKRTSFTTSLSRGCPYSCSFCSNSLVHGSTFRHVSPSDFERLLRQLPGVPDHHEVSFCFEDDNLLSDIPFFLSVLESCRRVFARCTFTAENGLDYRLLSVRLCDELIDTGFRKFNFTLCSTSRNVLDIENRSSDLEHYSLLCATASRRDVPVVTYVICGFPEDTRESIAENLRFLRGGVTCIGISLFYPVPGIRGFETRGMFDTVSPQLCAGSSAFSWNQNLESRTLVTAFRLARLLNLEKNPSKTREEEELVMRSIHERKLFTVIKKQGKRIIIEVPEQDRELAERVLR